MEFNVMLQQLGVHDGLLNAEEKSSLDHDGFVILRDVFTREQIAALQSFIDGYIAAHKPTRDEPGCDRLYHLIDKSPLIDNVWTNPRLLAAAQHILKAEFRPMSVNYRTALPGHGHQELHSDRTWTAAGQHSYGQAIIAMVDFSPVNGSTRAVPGTHRHHKVPADEMTDVRARHPRQMELTITAGSVFFFNGCLWHSGTQNNSSQPRPALHCGYSLRHSDNASLEMQRGTITKEMYDRLSPVRRNFLDLKVAPTLAPTDAHMF